MSNGVVSVEAKLVIDLGNSETRVLVQSGRSKNGLVRQKLATISNQFAPVPQNYNIPETYNEGNTVIFETEEGEVFANGLLVEREFTMTALRPTAIQKKQDAKVSMLTFRRAFLEGYRLLAKMYNVDDLSDLEVTSWNITYLLPPNDIEGGGKVVYEKVMNLKELNFTMPELKVDNLNIAGAKVFPEGFAAYIGTLMRRGRIINDDFKYLLSSKTLVVDIGAGTTDFFVVEGTETIDATKSTTQIGGNNVIASVRQGLIRNGITLPESSIEEAVRTGRVKDGAKTLNISEGLKNAKDYVAYSLIREITSYFEANMYPIRTIENLLVVGGGSIPSEVEGVESLSTYLVNRLREFSPNVELVGLPKEYKGNDLTGNTVNPRLLNILGAGILSET